MVTSNYSIGNLTSTPSSQSTYLSDCYTDDVYSFNISNTSSINLNLHNISAGDNADLFLYADSNGNGMFDEYDQQLQYSNLGGNSDDSINYLASAGTYFAQVVRDAPVSEGSLDYQLDLSATPDSPYPADTEPPNLLPTEVMVGDNSFGTLFEDKTFYGSVGDTNTADTYFFHLLRPSGFSFGSDTASITLSGLSSDADIRLIQDINENRIVDPGEVIASSTNGSTTDEFIANIGAGNYYLQIYQYSGNTNYTLNFDYTYVPPV
jgi:hypothetical protein